MKIFSLRYGRANKPTHPSCRFSQYVGEHIHTTNGEARFFSSLLKISNAARCQRNSEHAPDMKRGAWLRINGL